MFANVKFTIYIRLISMTNIMHSKMLECKKVTKSYHAWIDILIIQKRFEIAVELSL